MSFSDNLQRANELLAKIRGNTDSPGRVLHDLRAAGVTVEADKDTLRVKGPKIDPKLAERIRTHKAGILANLGEHTGEKFDFFVPAEADEIAAILLARLEAWDWNVDEETKTKVASWQDDIDRSYRDGNLEIYKKAAGELMKFLDSEPMTIAHATHIQGPGEHCLWAQRKQGKTTGQWMRIVNGIHDLDALRTFEKRFREITKLETKIVQQGAMP